jgi:hypothetical protein
MQQHEDGVQITPSDSADNSYRTVYVGVTGDVTVVTPKGTSLLFKAVPAGTLIPCKTSKVMATGTTATQLVGLI